MAKNSFGPDNYKIFSSALHCRHAIYCQCHHVCRMTTKDYLPHHVTCQMCSGPFSDPRILPCLHSFCCQCLHKEMEKVGPQKSLQCPTCLRNVPIPVGGASALTQNLHLGFEVEVAGYMSKLARSSGVSCTLCVQGCNDPAVVFCCSCHMFMCKGGKECHNRFPHMSQHNVIGLDRESATLLPTLIKPTEHHCSHPKHKKLDLDFYCKTCNCFICPLCVIAVHKDHSITELSTVAEADRDEMRRTLLCAQEVVSTLAGAIDANKKMMQQVETSKQKAELAIIQTFKQLVETLEERKKVLLMELETIALSKTTSLTLQKEQFEKIQHDISHYTEVTSHILQTHTDHEVVALRGLVPTELKATLKKVENVSLTPNPRSYISATLQPVSLAKVLSEFGGVVDLSPSPSECTCAFKSVSRVCRKYHVKVETKTSKGQRYPCGGLQVKAELRPKSHDGPVVLSQVEDHGDGTYTITLTPQTAGPHQLLITVDGHHVQGSPYDLEVERDYTSLCDVQQVVNVKDPLCVAIHENGDIYVGSIDRHIYVFDQGGHLKNTIGSKGSGDGQFNAPCSISIIGEVMYIADCGNHRIQKLTTGGKFLQKFGKEGSGQRQFNNSNSVVVDSKNRVIVSDWDNNRVQVFSQDGDWLLTIDGTGSGDNCFQHPMCLSLDPQGNIHVAARDANTIKVFTPEGIYVRSYGDVKKPSGVAVDKEGYSFVSDLDGGCFSIFDPKGQKIHTVGNLNKPLRLALDPLRGSLYVPNYGTSSVLKYSLQ